jgi:hypothetical protein
LRGVKRRFIPEDIPAVEEDLTHTKRRPPVKPTMTVEEAVHRLMTRPCINVWPELGLFSMSAEMKPTKWFAVTKSKRFVLAG